MSTPFHRIFAGHREALRRAFHQEPEAGHATNPPPLHAQPPPQPSVAGPSPIVFATPSNASSAPASERGERSRGGNKKGSRRGSGGGAAAGSEWDRRRYCRRSADPVNQQPPPPGAFSTSSESDATTPATTPPMAGVGFAPLPVPSFRLQRGSGELAAPTAPGSTASVLPPAPAADPHHHASAATLSVGGLTASGGAGTGGEGAPHDVPREIVYVSPLAEYALGHRQRCFRGRGGELCT